jgi:TatD DNase family protein
MDILDFHTHHADAEGALISVNPRQFDPQPGLWYSVGFHPWDDVDTLTDDDFILLEQCARHPQVLAIGETGMDRLRGAGLDVQAAVFIRHLQLAAELGLPVIAHCVRAAQEIVAAKRQAGLTAVSLVLHGLRANEHVARMLLDAGCYLSFGIRFNPDALRSTPLDRLLIETDDAPVTIQEVADAIAPVLQMSSEQVIKTAAGNAQRLLIK